MKFYCGIDLSARDCHVCVIDQQLNIVVQNLRNELPKKVQLLEPYKADLKIVAYIYPVETRPVRDLLRRRLHLVQVRAGEYGSLRRLMLRQGILSSKQQEIKTATETELEQWFTHPLVRLHASQELRRIELYSEQIAELEKTILELAQTERSYELLRKKQRRVR